MAIWIAWDSIVNEGNPVCWSAVCINDALGMMKLPLGLAALVFPCVALVTANHRSLQSKAQLDKSDRQLQKADEQIANGKHQIDLTRSKNTFDQYFNHTEHFQKMIKGLTDLNGVQRVEVFDEMGIYRQIFHGNSPLDFSPIARPLKQYTGFASNSPKIGLIELVIGNFNRLREYPTRKEFGEEEAKNYCAALRFIARHLNIVAINHEGKRFIMAQEEGKNRFTIAESMVVDRTMADYIARLIDFSIDSSSGRDKLDMNMLPGKAFEAFKNNEEYMNAIF
ncbi:hypothetical protein AB8E32_00340 [Marinomonas polaris]|uniref:hypothetical protein n=1 Tax=Marinomonas polaris TaxID=293552 RepID=UPI0035119A72